VIGVVVAKLNALAMLKREGTLGENVAFAIKGSEVVKLLRGVRVPTALKTKSRARAIEQVQSAVCQVLAVGE